MHIDPRLQYFHDLASLQELGAERRTEALWGRENSWDFVDGDEVAGADVRDEATIFRQVAYLALLCEEVSEQFPGDHQTQTAVLSTCLLACGWTVDIAHIEAGCDFMETHSFLLLQKLGQLDPCVYFVIDFRFKDLFKAARPTAAYQNFLDRCRTTFVGTRDSLWHTIVAMTQQLEASFTEQALLLAPWRSVNYVSNLFNQAITECLRQRIAKKHSNHQITVDPVWITKFCQGNRVQAILETLGLQSLPQVMRTSPLVRFVTAETVGSGLKRNPSLNHIEPPGVRNLRPHPLVRVDSFATLLMQTSTRTIPDTTCDSPSLLTAQLAAFSQQKKSPQMYMYA